MSRVITEFDPITARSPISTPPVTTQLTPNQQFEPIRTGPWGSKPCHVTGLVGSSKRWSESPTKQLLANIVVADLDQLERREHRVLVEEAALADPDPCLAVEGEPAARFEQGPLPDLEVAGVEGLENLALDRVADEIAALGGVTVDPASPPPVVVALIPAPLPPPGAPLGKR